jgi:integrase
MPRTSNTIVRRNDGRYQAQGTFSGKRRFFFGKTPDEARKKLTAAQALADKGQTAPPERESVAAYLRTWLKGMQPKLRPESYRRYREAIELHLLPELGHFKLARLQPEEIEACYANLYAKKLSATTVALIHGVLRKALADAVRRKRCCATSLRRTTSTHLNGTRRKCAC